jgi:hypothetical protein
MDFYTEYKKGWNKQMRFLGPLLHIGLHYIPITMKREKVYLYKRRYNFPVSSHEDSDRRWNVVLSSLLWHGAQFRLQSCKTYTPDALYAQGNSLALISLRGWVDSGATECRQKEQVTWKFPRTPTGNRNRNLPSCGTVPQSTLAPLAPY